MDARPHIFDLDPVSLRDILTGVGMKPFRAEQVLRWVYERGVAAPNDMSDLSKGDRDKLAQTLRFATGVRVAHQTASDGVQKLLIDWASPKEPVAAERECATPCEGGEGAEEPAAPAKVASLSVLPTAARGSASQTECVMIPTDNRRTACISSQVGCPVGCKFCASGLGGLDGDLTAGQIVEQVWTLSRLPEVGRVSHVVFMGMGEPLANFEQVAKALRTLSAPWGLGISARRITVSTVGLPAQIRRLAGLEIPVTLAISLHAPNDVLRRQLIPWAQYVAIAQLVEAGRYYFEQTGREVTLEYILLRNVNDRPEHARELARVAKGLRSNINLIRYNEVKGLPFDRPTTQDVLDFQGLLRDAGVNAHIRASRGRDIAGACGQLRHEKAGA